MEELESCISCQSQPIKFKKRKLCQKCYSKLRYKNLLPSLYPIKRNIQNSEIFIQQPSLLNDNENKAEILFAQNNPKMFYQPAMFYLSNGQRYTPDFYDPKSNSFIEIIGSRQRYHQLLPKLNEFKKTFPKIKIEILCGNGEPYRFYNPKTE